MGYYNKNMSSSDKNINDQSLPTSQQPNKKAVIRTYAMDIAAAKQGTDNKTSTQTPTPTKDIPEIPVPPTKKETTPLSIPLPPTADVIKKPELSKSTPPVPPAPPKNLIPEKKVTKEVVPSKPAVIPVPPHKPLPEKPIVQTPQPTKIKNIPEIPVHLEITLQDKVNANEPALKKVWSWLTSSGGKAHKSGGIEIREDIVVPKDENIPVQPNKTPIKKVPSYDKPTLQQALANNPEAQTKRVIPSPVAIKQPAPPKAPEIPQTPVVKTKEIHTSEQKYPQVKVADVAPVVKKVIPVVTPVTKTTIPVVTPVTTPIIKTAPAIDVVAPATKTDIPTVKAVAPVVADVAPSVASVIKQPQEKGSDGILKKENFTFDTHKELQPKPASPLLTTKPKTSKAFITKKDVLHHNEDKLEELIEEIKEIHTSEQKYPQVKVADVAPVIKTDTPTVKAVAPVVANVAPSVAPVIKQPQDIKPMSDTHAIPTKTTAYVPPKIPTAPQQNIEHTAQAQPAVTHPVGAWVTTDNEQQKIHHPTISPLHTYKMDITDTIKEAGESKTSILAKQQDAQPIANDTSKKEKRMLMWFAIGGAFLLILSIIGTGYAYQYHVKKVAPAQTAQIVPSLVSTNATKEISGTGETLLNMLSQVAQTPLQNGVIKTVYIATSTRESDGLIEKQPLPGGYLIAAMHLSMPAILVNNTAIDSTVGVVGANNQTYPFFILRVASYDSAFAGMLRWEGTISSDMKVLYPVAVNTASVLKISTSTIPSQEPVSSPEFVDKTIANHNVRVLQNTNNESILMYGFANKHTLIIARDAPAFIVLLAKLSKQ